MNKTMGYTTPRILARGLTTDGRKIKITGAYSVFATDRKLVELKISQWVIGVYCDGNPDLKTIDLPDTVKFMACDPSLLDYDTTPVEIIDVYYK